MADRSSAGDLRCKFPADYLGFFLLHNSKSYLGDDVVRGPKGALWNSLLIVAIVVVAAGAVAKILSFF